MIEIIAEIGVNHNGDYHTACQLIDAAIAAGCDTVKTQLFNVERVYPRERWDEMKKLELTRHEIESLKKYCDGKGIEFLCTPDEIEDAQFLKDIGVKRIKVSSQDITNLPFLRKIAELGLPVILSTGACDDTEMNAAMADIKAWQLLNGEQSLTVLHCVSAYPPPGNEMNLNVIRVLAAIRRKLNGIIKIGLSDHTTSELAALVALGCGARVFEKHLTLDILQPGPDHCASLDPQDMTDYVAVLREAATMLGDGIKRVMPCEVENRKRYEEFIKPRLAQC